MNLEFRCRVWCLRVEPPGLTDGVSYSFLVFRLWWVGFDVSKFRSAVNKIE